jgi:hypothetical protein
VLSGKADRLPKGRSEDTASRCRERAAPSTRLSLSETPNFWRYRHSACRSHTQPQLLQALS